MKNLMIMSLLFGVITSTVSSIDGSDGIYAFKVGGFDVFMIVEGERDGNAGILVQADESVLKRYIPESGFKHSTNVFLIKAKDQNILIDTGTGAGGIVIEKLKKIGVEPEQVNSVLITHLHGDHFGSLQREGNAVFPNAKVYLSQKEYDHFTKTSVNQGAVAALAPYNVVTFEPAELGTRRMRELLPGITPVQAYGHTPGHTVYLVKDKRNALLIIGDLLHVALVQFPVPEINATYDMTPLETAASRRKVLEYALKNKISVGGMHIVYPAVGRVARQEKGFLFTPD